MAERTATATWKGTLADGKGKYETGSGAAKGKVTYKSRFEEGKGSNPEELLGAAHAMCFSQALSLELTEAGYESKKIETKSRVNLAKQGDDFVINRMIIDVMGDVSGIDQGQFRDFVGKAAQNCPVAKALTGVDIQVGEVSLK